MLNIKAKAEVRAVALRKQFHGDEKVRALTVRLDFRALKLEDVQAAFVSQLALVFDKAGDPALPEVGPLKVTRKVDAVDAHLGDVTIRGLDCDGVRLTLQAGRTVDVTLKLKGECPYNVLDDLLDQLLEEVDVELVERAPGQEQLAAVG